LILQESDKAVAISPTGRGLAWFGEGNNVKKKIKRAMSDN
jgi:hypothetical protein